MKMIVGVDEWTFECFGPRNRAKGNAVLKKYDIIEVSNDFAVKLAKRGVATVYRGPKPGVPFPPDISSGLSAPSAAVLDVLKEIDTQKDSAGAKKDDGANGGAGKGAVNVGKS